MQDFLDLRFLILEWVMFVFHEGFMIIKVEKNKTDQLKQGDEVITAHSEGYVCPVFYSKSTGRN